MTSPSPDGTTHKPYWCFISYRQIDNKILGRQWATWLHQQIETYEVPSDLVGTVNQRGETIPSRIFPVFRDEEELSAVADLNKPIYQALDRSLFMLVLCTPRSVASPYVADEITYFKALGKSDRVLAALIDGEPKASWDAKKQALGFPAERECFPEPLQHEVNAAGKLDKTRRIEPIAADFRLQDSSEGWTSPEAYKDHLEKAGKFSSREIHSEVERYLAQCKLAKLKILSGILGVELGSLTKRDRAYQLEKEKRRTRIFRRVAAGMGVLALLATGAGVLAYLNGQKAEKNLAHANSLLWEASYSSWNEAERSRAAGHPQDALAYLAKGMENAPANKGLATFAYSLMGSEMLPWRTILADYPVVGVAFDASGENLVVVEEVYDESLRYSLWNLQAVSRTDSVDVAADGAISAELLAARPWLKDAPKLESKIDEVDGMAPVVSAPGGFEKLTFGQADPTPEEEAANETPEGNGGEEDSTPQPSAAERAQIKIVPDGLAGGFLGPAPEFTLSNSGSPYGYSASAWNSDSTRVAMVQGTLQMSEKERGKITVWDLRRPDGTALIPEKTVPFGELPKSHLVSKNGSYELWVNMEDTYEIRRSGQSSPLWKPSSEVKLDGPGKRVLVLQKPEDSSDEDPEDSLDARPKEDPKKTGELLLEWRDIDTGAVIARKTAKVPGLDSSDKVVAEIHPSGLAATILVDDSLVVWTDANSEPQVLPLPCPKDSMGWANAITFAPDGKTIFLGSRRRLLALSWPGLELVAGPAYHDSLASHIAVSTDGKRLLSSSGFGDGAGSTGYGQLWKLPDLKEDSPRFRHNEEMSGVGFIEDGATLYTASESPEGSALRLWEAKTALPLSAYLKAPDLTGQAFISFDSATPGEVEAIRMKGQVDSWGEGTYLARLPRPGGDIPEWFYKHFLPLVSGKRVGPEGAMEDLKPNELEEHFKQLSPLISASEKSIYHEILRWYFSDPSTRPLDPWSSTRLNDYLEASVFRPVREKEYHGGLGHAYRLDPSHPLLHLHLALKEEDPKLRARLIAYGLQRLKLESNAKTYGSESWKAQLITGKEILKKLGEPPNVLADLNALIQKL